MDFLLLFIIEYITGETHLKGLLLLSQSVESKRSLFYWILELLNLSSTKALVITLELIW